MRRLPRTTAIVVTVLGLLGAACSDTEQSQSSGSTASETLVTADVDSLPDTAPGTSAVTTTTVDPTVFNPNNIGDLRDLDSFIFTIAETHVANGTPNARTTTVGYIRDPFNAYVVANLGSAGTVQEYLIDGRYFERDHQNYWTIHEAGSLATPDLIYPLAAEYALSSVLTAQYVGEEAFAGVAAYHFTFDETNLINFGSYSPANPSPEAEGEFFLAKEGNYPLYVYYRMVASGAGYELIDEYTETVTEINQVSSITLPADLVPMQEALDLGHALEIPMPSDGALDTLINYNAGGVGVYYYEFTSSWKTEAEFMAFYQSLPPTNGWEVIHLGRVRNLDVHCGDGNCVMIKNGDKQVILYFDGSNLHADYDREHQFAPQ